MTPDQKDSTYTEDTLVLLIEDLETRTGELQVAQDELSDVLEQAKTLRSKRAVLAAQVAGIASDILIVAEGLKGKQPCVTPPPPTKTSAKKTR